MIKFSQISKKKYLLKKPQQNEKCHFDELLKEKKCRTNQSELHDNSSKKKAFMLSYNIEQQNPFSEFSTEQKEEARNELFIKKTFKSIKRYRTEENEKLKENQNEFDRINKLKEYVKQLTATTIKKEHSIKIFRSTEKHCRNNQLHFIEIDEEKVKMHEQFLKNHQLIERDSYKSSKSTRNLNKVNFSQNSFKGFKENISICLKLIDKIYRIIFQISKLGYRKKSHKNIILFCTTNKIWMSRVFLTPSKDQIFSKTINYDLIFNIEEVKTKFSIFLSANQSKQIKQIIQDLNEFYEHIENILIQKKRLELTQISDYLQQKLIAKRKEKMNENEKQTETLRFSMNHNEEFTFVNELQRIQEKYGELKGITKISRRRFQDLNKTYDKLQEIVN